MLRLKVMLAAILALLAVRPAFPQAIAGMTPKGIAYRYQHIVRGEEVAVYFAWRYAADAKDKDESWIHYLLPAMWDGAGDDSRETVERKLRELGVTHGSLSPQRLTVAAYVMLQRGKLDQVAALLTQIVQKPTYASKDLDERYKKILMPLRDKFNREPVNQLQFAALALNFPNLAGGGQWMALSEASIKPPASETLRQVHQRTLGRSNLVVSVAGNLSEGDAAAFIDRVFGALPALAESPPPPPDTRTVDKVIKIERDVPQVYAQLYGVIAGENDPKKIAALRLATAAFGNGKDSALYKVLRDEMGAAYSTSSSEFVIAPQTSLIKVAVQLDPEKAPQAVVRLREEYRKLFETGIDEPALKSETGRATAPFNPATIVARQRALLNLTNALRGYPEDVVQRLRKAYGELTTDEVNGVISQSMAKAATVLVMAPAAVTIEADCTIKAYSETAKCGF
jgi:zinc protease